MYGKNSVLNYYNKKFLGIWIISKRIVGVLKMSLLVFENFLFDVKNKIEDDNEFKSS